MVDKTLCEVVRLGKLVYVIVKQLDGSSGDERFYGCLFHNLELRSVDTLLGLQMSFFEEGEDHALASVAD